MHVHLSQNRTTRTIALTTAGLVTAGLLAAAVALLPPGASANPADAKSAALTLTGEETGLSSATPQPAASATPEPTADEAAVAEAQTAEANRRSADRRG